MREPLFYVEPKGDRWAKGSVAFRSEAAARTAAADCSHDCFLAIVWDCSNGPIGELVATYEKGIEVPHARAEGGAA